MSRILLPALSGRPQESAVLIAGYFSVGALVWCWEGAYNVLQGDDPAYGFHCS